MKPTQGSAVSAWVAVLTLGILLRVAYVAVPQGLSHDEAATLIFASCEWSSYQAVIDGDRPPIALKTTVGVWRDYVESDGRICLGRIFRDELSADVHPPLYHAVLNTWKAVFGDSLPAARSLNLVIDVVAATIFFLLASTVLARSWAMVALLIYLVAPGFSPVVSEIRPYALLGLLNVATLWAALRIVGGATEWRWWFTFGVACVAGIYTHYLFVLVAVPVSLLLITALVRQRDRTQLSRGFTTLLAEIVLTLPLVVALWRYQLGVATDIGWSGEWLVGKSPLPALTWSFASPIIGAFEGIIFELPGAVNLLMAGTMVAASTYGLLQTPKLEVRWLLTVVLWVTVVGHIGLYAVGALPSHAIGAKYQVLAVPYILLSLIFLMRSFEARWMRVAGVVSLAGLMLIGSLRLIWRDFSARDQRISAATVTRMVPEVDLLVLDTSEPGLVPPIVESWPSQHPIVIGSQEVLSRPGSLAGSVRGAGSIVYLSTLRFGNSSEARTRILAELREVLGEGAAGVAVDSLGSLGCIGCGRGYEIFLIRAGGS